MNALIKRLRNVLNTLNADTIDACNTKEDVEEILMDAIPELAQCIRDLETLHAQLVLVEGHIALLTKQ